MPTVTRASASPPPSKPGGDPRIGTTIGQCLIQQKLGQGGMGTVYLARHLTLNKPVALKVLRGDLPTDLQGVERFLREARAAARLEHHRIVQVYDAGQHDGTYYIVMQYISGESLALRLRRESKLIVPEALRIFRAVAEGIAYAHTHGIVHRDIKPDNILLADDGAVKIVDFGLACVIEGDPNLSRTGTILGSPNFMSPEQALGKRVDQRTDIYSLGATLFQTLTGVPPFQASSSIGVVCKVVKEPLKPPHEVNSAVPGALSKFVCHLMRKDRERRPPTVKEMLALLDRVQAAGPSPPPARRPRRRGLLTAIVLAAVALLLGAAFIALHVARAWAAVEAPEAPGSRSAAVAPGGPAPPQPPPPVGPRVSAGPMAAREPPSPARPLAPELDRALRARFEELQGHVAARRLDEARRLVDPGFLERWSGGRRKPFGAGGRILGDFLDDALPGASVRRTSWEDPDRGIARIELDRPGRDRSLSLLWALRDGTWYCVPPPPRVLRGGDGG
ncbi:MAG: serine/threonine protein kinase [Planctomycetes bacterium]|nr:serine/threonine protein kinase [Planctomycetota bacterium]